MCKTVPLQNRIFTRGVPLHFRIRETGHYAGILIQDPPEAGTSSLSSPAAKRLFEQYLDNLTRPDDLIGLLHPEKFLGCDAAIHCWGIDLTLMSFGINDGREAFADFHRRVAEVQQPSGMIFGTYLASSELAALDREIQDQLRTQGRHIHGEPLIGAHLELPNTLIGPVAQPPFLQEAGYLAFDEVTPIANPTFNEFTLRATNILYVDKDGVIVARVGLNYSGRMAVRGRSYRLGEAGLTVPAAIAAELVALRSNGRPLDLPSHGDVEHWLGLWALAHS